jgi:hypothetical protein
MFAVYVVRRLHTSRWLWLVWCAQPLLAKHIDRPHRHHLCERFRLGAHAMFSSATTTAADRWWHHDRSVCALYELWNLHTRQ